VLLCFSVLLGCRPVSVVVVPKSDFPWCRKRVSPLYSGVCSLFVLYEFCRLLRKANIDVMTSLALVNRRRSPQGRSVWNAYLGG